MLGLRLIPIGNNVKYVKWGVQTFINFTRVLFSLPVKLILVILSAFLFGDLLPIDLKSALLTSSLAMKEMLLFVLPAIVFFLVFSSFAELTGGFIMFTGLLLSLVCISNLTAVITAYPVGLLTQNYIVTTTIENANTNSLEPFFKLGLPKICSNSTALVIGIILGIYSSISNNIRLKKLADKGSRFVNLFLVRIFTPLLPLFILGFILKAQHDGLLVILFRNFVPLLSVISLLFIAYIGSIYLIASKMSISGALLAIKNILPAAIVGFCSMSSAAAMPVLLDGTTKNAVDANIPKRIVPFITNTHMMGDALAIPLMAMSLYILEYNEMPPLSMYLPFAVGYMFAKFASAGIPGGTILIMTPVLESQLGFTSEMSTIILTTYLLFDPFCTFGSILGNGSFAKIFEILKTRVENKAIFKLT